MQTKLVVSCSSDLDELINNARAGYPALWRQMIESWHPDDGPDAAWLTYAANYLLRTDGVHWALDPYSLVTRVGGVPQPDFSADLASLQLVVLSHAHNDHLDLALVSALRDLPITWVIPDFMRQKVLAHTSLAEEKIITPQPGTPIQFQGLVIVPFNGLHMRGERGVPEMGYLAEFGGKRWLFPGDTRDYDWQRLPSFGRLDGVFAHLWLGKACALHNPPPLMDDFCNFFLHLNPARIVISHMLELGRPAEERWTAHHFELVRARFRELAPIVLVEPAFTGEKVLL